MALNTSATGVPILELVNMRSKIALLSKWWLGSLLKGRRECEVKYSLAEAGFLMDEEITGLANMSSFDLSVDSFPETTVALLVCLVGWSKDSKMEVLGGIGPEMLRLEKSLMMWFRMFRLSQRMDELCLVVLL